MKTDAQTSAGHTKNLLASEVPPSETIWLILSTKRHLSDHSRLKPGKVALPHPLPPPTSDPLTICLIVPDPPGPFTAILAHPAFPTSLAARITRTLSIKHLKSATKSFEERRALLAAHDIFLADDRIVTLLPRLLGKTFFATATKRPLPVRLAAASPPTQVSAKETSPPKPTITNADGTKEHSIAAPKQVARELERALASVPVYLTASTTTSIRAGTTAQTGAEVAANVEALVVALAARFVPQGWRNVRALHIKGPRTPALPIWLADTLWVDDGDVREEMMDVGGSSKRKKLTDGSEEAEKALPGQETDKQKKKPKISAKREVGEGGFGVEMADRRKKLREARKAAREELDREQREELLMDDDGDGDDDDGGVNI